jgi:hypothetical protein
LKFIVTFLSRQTKENMKKDVMWREFGELVQELSFLGVQSGLSSSERKPLIPSVTREMGEFGLGMEAGELQPQGLSPELDVGQR